MNMPAPPSAGGCWSRRRCLRLLAGLSLGAGAAALLAACGAGSTAATVATGSTASGGGTTAAASGPGTATTTATGTGTSAALTSASTAAVGSTGPATAAAIPPSGAGAAVRISVWGDKTDKPVYDAIVQDFNAAQHSSRATDEQFTGSYYVKLQAELAGGVAPDLLYFQGWSWQPYANNDALAPLDQYMQTDKYTAAWPDIPNYNDNTRWHGKTYMSSADTGAIVMFYSKLLLDKYGVAAPKDGWTYADFQTLVEKMSRKDGDTTYYGYAQAGGWMGAYLRSLQWMRMDGELEWDTVVEPHKAQFMLPSILANLQYTVVDTIQRGFSPGPKTPGASKLKIDTGTVALTPEGPWYLAYLQGDHSSLKGGIPYDVVDMPLGKNGKIMTDAEVHGHVLNKASKHPDAAWALLRFVTEDQGQQRIAAGGRMCNTPETISKIWVPLAQKAYNFQNGAAFVRAMQQGSSPIISGAGANYDAVAGAKKPLDTAWTAMLSGTPAKDALQVANPQVQSLLDDYWKKATA